MPARKRSSALANGVDDAAEPVAKRRSSRQAAATTASKSATAQAKKPAAVQPEARQSSKAATSKASSRKAAADQRPEANGKVSGTATEEEAKPAKKTAPAAPKSGAKNGKGAKAAVKEAREDGGDREASADPDVDSIPAVNPDAPRHEGEWYWLMKAEPETRMENGHDVRFSIDDLRAKTKPEGWDGIRAYPARNNMRNMNVGDKAFFYHSNCKEPGIVGIMEIVKEFSEDRSARRPGTPYYDPSSTRDKPKWDLVHVEFRKKFAVPIYLKELRALGGAGGPLETMQMLKLGRLSVSRVSAEEWRALCERADDKAKEAGLEHEE